MIKKEIKYDIKTIAYVPVKNTANVTAGIIKGQILEVRFLDGKTEPYYYLSTSKEGYPESNVFDVLREAIYRLEEMIKSA